jgi:photosystem II stability/assembly factor-like uncharacterized protein
VLSSYADMLRSSDGTHWTVRPLPGFGQPTFLPDLQHGWLNAVVPGPLNVPSPSPVTGKGGGGTTSGKGDGGTTSGKGGGGATAPAPCQEKGCQPTALWSTSDGGNSWRLVLRSTWAVTVGSLYFWSPTDGMIDPVQGLNYLRTDDGGLTWTQGTLQIEGVDSTQVQQFSPTMFDANHGVLPVEAGPVIYLSRTIDGGRTWSRPVRMNDCAGCGGQVVFVDDQHWIDYSAGVNVTADGGQTWRKVTTTNPGKSTNAIEVVKSPTIKLIALAPGLFASETADWGAHWRAVELPDIYPTYSGFEGDGGWSGV